MKNEKLLDIQNLSVSFKTKRGFLKAVNNASLTIHENESVALIGESGCGKTTLSTSIVDILPLGAMITDGKILYKDVDEKVLNLLELKKSKLRTLLWSKIAMMFQASQSSFNPVKKIRMDFIDTVKAHKPRMSEREIIKRSEELLKMVMLDANLVLNSYPHELSGGMKQRALLALSLLLEPKLIILDEPTTALDLLTQEKIVVLLNELKQQYGFSYLFITHDLSIVSELADVVVTMYAGRIIEKSPVKEFFKNTKHPYSLGLIKAIPKLSLDHTELFSIPGSPPDLVEDTIGCPFAPRCDRRLNRCSLEMPNMIPADNPHHEYACWNPNNGD
ncbi:ABC transporter ATP-binding protein [Psychrobacillus antarcticus]|uniref:ABC transporter ATP-binding protein n=1 Tax=Psychrobacillus antarcticus TaxID=2879115 RepID=UPI0024081F46|nr:ABC transporter ATP-binding protein [Psychrobacillus antarcticus]